MLVLSQQESDRRPCFATLAASSAALAAGSIALGLDSRPALAEGADVTSPMSEAWLAKLTGKHKQFFDATSSNQFAPVFAMNFLNSNNDTYKLPDSSISAVVGLRHFALPMALTDDIWSRYKVGEFTGTIDPATKAPAQRNIFYHPHEGDIMFPTSAIDKLIDRGVQFTACNVALTVLSGVLSKNAGVTPEQAKKEWVAGLIPGVVLVPSGALAVNRPHRPGPNEPSRGCADDRRETANAQLPPKGHSAHR